MQKKIFYLLLNLTVFRLNKIIYSGMKLRRALRKLNLYLLHTGKWWVREFVMSSVCTRFLVYSDNGLI